MSFSPEEAPKKGQLLRSEWTLILSLLCIMLTFGIIAKVKAFHCSEELPISPLPAHEMCTVTVDGAVFRPATFLVPPGTPLKNILRKAKLFPSANLREVDLGFKVEKSMHVHIEELSELLVTIQREGQEPFCYEVPVGTKVSELKSFVPCSKEEAKQVFKSRRLVKDGEVFVVCLNTK